MSALTNESLVGIRVQGSLVGWMESDGSIRKGGSLVDKMEHDGGVLVAGSLSGRMESDGTLRKNRPIVGSVQGVLAEQAAGIFFRGLFSWKRLARKALPTLYMVPVPRRFGILPLVFGVALLAAPAALDIPYVRQTGAGCGWASVAMVMQYWVKHQPGLDPLAAAAERIEKDLHASRNGLSGKQLTAYFDSHGFTTYVISGDLGDLEQHTGKGRPVIVCLGVKGRGAPLHYAVVAGVTPNSILLNDPARGKLYEEDLETFSRAWKATDHWALLAVPKPAQ